MTLHDDLCPRLARFHPVLRGLLLAAVLVSCPAHADDTTCGAPVNAWIQRCSQGQDLRVLSAQCPPARLVLELAVDPTPLRVELAHGAGGFRQVAGFALSPIVDVSDWNAVPGPQRAAFERLAACVAAEPALQFIAAPVQPSTGGALAPPQPFPQPLRPAAPWAPIPVHLLVALIVLVVTLRPALVAAFKRAPRQVVTVLAVLPAATFVLRRLTFPQIFAHQNGHGAAWVAEGFGGPMPYGPGFHELFGWAVQASPQNPEAAVFLVQGALAAWQPACAWLLVRAMGASRRVAWAGALVVALDPALARLSGSESYYSACISLLFAAAAVIAVAGARRTPLSQGQRLLAFVVAALFIAQAARLHPLSWLPAATLPLLLLLMPGPARLRLRAAAIAGAVIAVTVGVTSGGALLAVYRAAAPGHWQDTLVGHVGGALAHPVALIAVLVAGILALRGVFTAQILFISGAVVLVSQVNDMPGAMVPDSIQQGLRWLVGPTLVGCVAAWAAHVSSLTSRRRDAVDWTVAVALVAAAIVGLAVRFAPLHELPTDVLEAEFSRTWRAQLGPDDALVLVGRLPPRVVELALYPGHDGRTRQVRHIAPGDAMPALDSHTRRTFYYRSSICAAVAARDRCAAFERGLLLKPVARATLPNRASMTGLEYAAGPVEVALFEVLGPAHTVE